MGRMLDYAVGRAIGRLKFDLNGSILLRVVCSVLSAVGVYEPAGKHTAYDPNELNRRWALLWGLIAALRAGFSVGCARVVEIDAALDHESGHD